MKYVYWDLKNVARFFLHPLQRCWLARKHQRCWFPSKVVSPGSSPICSLRVFGACLHFLSLFYRAFILSRFGSCFTVLLIAKRFWDDFERRYIKNIWIDWLDQQRKSETICRHFTFGHRFEFRWKPEIMGVNQTLSNMVQTYNFKHNDDVKDNHFL